MLRRMRMVTIDAWSWQLTSGPKLAYTTAKQNLPSLPDLSGKVSEAWILKQTSIGAHLPFRAIHQATPNLPPHRELALKGR